MKKSITAEGHEYTIRTVNGVSTRTGAIWAKQIKDFTPLPNGFNLGLAMEVYTTIKENQHLWDQGSWRRLLRVSELTEDELKELKSMAAFELDATAPACGTAMCMAGWVAELSGADYVYDSTAMKEGAPEDVNNESVLEYILVPRSELRPPAQDSNLTWDLLAPETRRRVQERGFSVKTHALMWVEDYAKMMLGLIDGDWREMFDGSNDLDAIRQAIEAYAEDGPNEDNSDDDITY